jgi:1,4-alpha-glucan branching enzyme
VRGDDAVRKKTADLSDRVESCVRRILAVDPLLKPYADVFRRRLRHIEETEKRLTTDSGHPSLHSFASGHAYFGLHWHDHEWVFREWAPNATAIYIIGTTTHWQEQQHFALRKINDEGIWEGFFPPDSFQHGDLYRLRVHWRGGFGDRIPSYACRVVQDEQTKIFNAQVWLTHQPYPWRHSAPSPSDGPLLIYEAHIGMAQEAGRVGTYHEFQGSMLPRIVRAGYNAIQFMAIQEHPYYGSFGYQVSSFFAASSRFGAPEDLKALIDAAHGAGLRVFMDLIHSHAALNEVEGLSRFDGTTWQYFHEGERGLHPSWHSRCFDYGKQEVLHFLLSNCRFWLEEYRFDGLRFDGITSMLYKHHGLQKEFTNYAQYFGDDVDEDAITYLSLANKLVHDINPDAITIAEDVSGMPTLALPRREGGTGFDLRFAMGIPDYWIKLVKDVPDEAWPLDALWFELNNRRQEEHTISYAESHDQALVGDQTLIFRLIGADMYDHMSIGDSTLKVDRGIALFKMIRLITLATADTGYLNFMGNEFGHPEWIDFPREGNSWSYHYARRQWNLADNETLRYRHLAQFDRDCLALTKRVNLISRSRPYLNHIDNHAKVLAFSRAGLTFVFNFHPTQSHMTYAVPMKPGAYRMVLNTDETSYSGHNRLEPDQTWFTMRIDGSDVIRLYLPTRTAIILKPKEKI